MRVELSCPRTPCTSLQSASYGNQNYNALPVAQPGSAYSARVFSGGTGVVPQFWGAPPGLTLDASGMIKGEATVPGTYKLGFKVQDNCPWNRQLLTGTASLTIKDQIAPKLVSMTLGPDTVAWNGGNVTLVVRATDNNAVFHVMMNYARPDGSTSSAPVPQTSGNPKDGEWKLVWETALNSTAGAQTYKVTVTVSDGDGNSFVSPAKTFVVAAHQTTGVIRPPVRP